MRKLFYLIIVMLVLGLLLPAAAVADETQSKLPLEEEMVSITAAIPMLLDGTWVILDEVMPVGAYFSGSWTWVSDLPVEFTITDYYVVTDIFEVYDGGSFVIQTPNLPDWDDLGFATPHTSPPWESDPATAFASGYFSCAVIYFASGLHLITIRDIHIPPVSAGGPDFPDGTVAFKAERLREWPIDIKPGSDPNSINTKSKGVIPVAILGSAIFDVTTVDVTTLEFGPDGATPAHDLTDPVVYADHLQDVNLDGFTDLVCHFKTQEAGLVMGDTDATLTGDTNDGETFTGMDSVNIVK